MQSETVAPTGRIARLGLVVALTTGMFGCAAGRLYGQGQDLEKEGHPYEAMQKYLDALDIKPEHEDSTTALRAVARKAYDAKLAICVRYEKGRDFPAAIEQYKELETQMARVRSRGALSFAMVSFFAKYAELKNAASEDHYVAGEAALAQRDWRRATREYDAAQGFTKGYKDTAEKTGTAYYSWAEDDLTAMRWRGGAEHFMAVVKAAGSGFRDASARASALYAALGRHFLGADRCRQAVRDLRLARQGSDDPRLAEDLARAEECSVTPVAILPLENPTGRNLAGMALGDTLSDAIGMKVQKKVSEFVRLVERAALQTILAEQSLTAAGIATGTVSKVRGVRYLVLGKLTQVRTDSQGPGQTRRSFASQESYECQKMDKGRSYSATCWRDITVGYQLVTAKVTARVAGSIKVVDTATGEQLVTQALDTTVSDQIAYATDFSRDLENIRVPDEVSQWAKARQGLRDEGELASDLIESLGNTAAEAVASAVDRERPATDPVVLELTAAL